MPTRITQFDAPERGSTVLRVEGSLHLADARVLERLCRDIIVQDSGRDITLDLADLSFIDSESADVLSRLKREMGVMLEGLHLFVQKVIELADSADDAV
jgi:anti-anti-sigma factor